MFPWTNDSAQSRWRSLSVRGTFFAEQDHTYRMSEAEYFHYRQNRWFSLIKSGNDTQPVRKLSDFNQAVSTLNRIHQEAGGQQLGPIPHWKRKGWKTGIEFFFLQVAMERILVVFLRIQRNVKKEVASKGLRSNGATRCFLNFGENLRQITFKNSFYFVTDKSFTADGGPLQPTGGCKDNTSKDPFSRWEICKNLGYRLSWRWQDTIGLQHPEEKNFALGISYAWWNAVDEQNLPAGRWGVWHQWQRENPDPAKHQHEAQHEHVNVRVVVKVFLVLVLSLLSHSFLAHIAWLKMSECLSHPIHAWSERFLWLPWSLHHLHLPPLILHHPQAGSTSLRLSRKIPCALRQGDGVYWRILLQHT